MPVKKVSDAPANIRKLDDVALTLVQVNHILRIFDSLEADGKMESPMAVAITQFRKLYHIEDDKWVREKVQEGAEGLSLEERITQLRDAFRGQFPRSGEPVAVEVPSFWVTEVYEDYVIINDEATGKYYQVGYEEGAEGIVFVAPQEWMEVEREMRYVAVREGMAVGLVPVDGAEGREWEITIIGAGEAGDIVTIDGQEALRSGNGRFYLVSALEASVGLWEGVKVFDNHLTDEEFERREGMRSVATEWMGTIVRPWWDAAQKAVKGILKVVEEGLAKKLLMAYEQGVLGTVGLSIDAFVGGREVEFEGQAVSLIEVIQQALSVDVVANPAAGGGFDRLLASESVKKHIFEGGSEMNEEELRALVAELVGKAVEGMDVGTAVAEAMAGLDLGEQVREQVEAAVAAALAESTLTDDGDDGDTGDDDGDDGEGVAEAQRVLNEAREVADRMLETAQLQVAQAALETGLAGSGLPDAFRDLVRERFVGRTFEAEELTGEIEAQRGALLRLSESGRVRGLGYLQPAQGGPGPEDQMFYRALATFGLRDEIPEEWRGMEASPAWRGLRDMYLDLTGDNEFYGRFYADRVMEANVTSTTMASTVANVLNKILVNAYFKREQWWEPLVVNRDLEKFQDMRLVSLYGFSALSAVGEGGAYTELSWDDYYETATPAKKGNYVGVTLEMMMKDDLETVRRIPEGLGAAAFNTVADLVSAFFTDTSGTGPTLTTTSRALWNGTDGNLLTSALSFDNFNTAAQTLMGITEQGSSRELGLMPGYLMVPTELYTTGRIIRNSESRPATTDNDVNPWYEQFEVVRIPTWTDADNWALIARPDQFEGIVLGWLFGKRQPEIFVADNELSGAMFTNDEMRVKVRFFVCAGVTDWRFGIKSNV